MVLNGLSTVSYTHLYVYKRQHIGYTSWDEPQNVNIRPKVIQVNASLYQPGNYEYEEKGGVIVMEAERCAKCTQGEDTQWTIDLYKRQAFIVWK